MDNGWDNFVCLLRQWGDLWPDPYWAGHHPACRFLHNISKRGVPAMMMTEPWSEAQCQQCLRWGPHKSCNEFQEFLREEMLQFASQGYWMVVPYRILAQVLEETNRKYDLWLVLQWEHHLHFIVNYSFYNVNQETLLLGPTDVMQLSRALEQTMYLVWHANPQYGPVHLGKVDLANGFYRQWLTLDAILMLAVIYPKHPNEEQMVALPFSLPMGWVESVPYFCAVTKTIADLANGLPTNKWLPPHPMEELANTPLHLPPSIRWLAYSQIPATTTLRVTLYHLIMLCYALYKNLYQVQTYILMTL